MPDSVERSAGGKRVANKVALVAGAGCIGPGWGNGKAAAVLYAREGAKIFAVDIRPGAAEETVAIIHNEGGEAIAHCADVTDEAAVEAMTAACVDAYGRNDILHNNVGGSGTGRSLETITVDDWNADAGAQPDLGDAHLPRRGPGDGTQRRRRNRQYLLHRVATPYQRAECGVFVGEGRGERIYQEHSAATCGQGHPGELRASRLYRHPFHPAHGRRPAELRKQGLRQRRGIYRGARPRAFSDLSRSYPAAAK